MRTETGQLNGRCPANPAATTRHHHRLPGKQIRSKNGSIIHVSALKTLMKPMKPLLQMPTRTVSHDVRLFRVSPNWRHENPPLHLLGGCLVWQLGQLTAVSPCSSCAATNRSVHDAENRPGAK